jgi:hypothetical protein
VWGRGDREGPPRGRIAAGSFPILRDTSAGPPHPYFNHKCNRPGSRASPTRCGKLKAKQRFECAWSEDTLSHSAQAHWRPASNTKVTSPSDARFQASAIRLKSGINNIPWTIVESPFPKMQTTTWVSVVDTAWISRNLDE